MASTEIVRPDRTLNELNKLYDEFWEFILQEFPTWATYLGDHRYDDRLEDASEEAFNRRTSRLGLFLERASSQPKLGSGRDRLNYELFKRQLEEDIEGARFRPYLTPLTQQQGVHIELPELITYHPFRSVEDYENFVSRLRKFPGLFDQIITNMKNAVRERIVLPKIVAEKIIPQIQVHVVEDVKRSEFYKPRLNLPKEIQARDATQIGGELEDAIKGSVVPSYAKLLQFFKEEYYPSCRDEVGVWALPDGRERYAYHVKHFTTTKLSPDEIHEIGLREVARIHGEIRALIGQAGFKGTLQEFAGSLRDDKEMYYHTREELLAGFKAILAPMDLKLPMLFGRLPKTKYDFREIEEYRAEAAPDAYYYLAPEDGSRPAYFYVNTYKPESRPKYTMEALAFHEAVPGHHMQLAIQQELEELPKFRRYGGFTAFIEGWALYSEELPKKVGFYKNPVSDFGRLTLEVWRAARLVVDTGIHHKRWTRDQAIQFMKENSALSEHNIVSEVDRYIAWPGQALAYKLGQLKIRELREMAEKLLGPRFDLRAFHDELLNDGALALDVLEQKVERWLEAQARAP